MCEETQRYYEAFYLHLLLYVYCILYTVYCILYARYSIAPDVLLSVGVSSPIIFYYVGKPRDLNFYVLFSINQRNAHSLN